jgi:muramoyltetrapeptide carboxypeptidase
MTSTTNIAIVAPASRIAPDLAERVGAIAERLYGERAALHFHPQCFLTSGHFAGTDDERADALIEVANDARFDFVWFARGGYGSGRIAGKVLGNLTRAARDKRYVGYSDLGYLLAGLHKNDCPVAHGPMPADLRRDGGDAAVARALRYMLDGDRDALEPHVAHGTPCAAFNITVLNHILGTPLEPDLSGYVVMLEEVSEHMYRIDRSLHHITSFDSIRRVAGFRLGRCSDIPPNDPEFGHDAEAVIRHWCAVSGIPYLGRADIGHDIDNKVVPFGRVPGA